MYSRICSRTLSRFLRGPKPGLHRGSSWSDELQVELHCIVDIWSGVGRPITRVLFAQLIIYLATHNENSMYYSIYHMNIDNTQSNKDELRKQSRKRWQQSEKGKAALRAAQKRYRQTEYGKKAIRERRKKYEQTEHGKALIKKLQKRYNHSERGQEAMSIRRKRFTQSEKGKATNRRNCKKHRYNVRTIISNIKTECGCMNPNCLVTWKLDSYCLDYHHIIGIKKFSIGCFGVRVSLADLVAEIRKCTILCAICHRCETWGELDASGFPTCKIDDNGNVIKLA